MKINTYNQKAEETEQVLLPKEVFEVAFNNDLVHQIVVSQQSNKRQGNAHTKDRGEVRGGGKKPWRQKGTGRARHGSTRSPIWIGGGVTFGPRNTKNYKKIVPKKMKRKALFMVLSQKVKDNQVFILDKLEFDKIKTKKAFDIIQNLKGKIKEFEKGSILIALSEKNDSIILSFRNIPKIQTIQAKDLNALDLLKYKYLILTKDSIKVLKDTFLKSKN